MWIEIPSRTKNLWFSILLSFRLPFFYFFFNLSFPLFKSFVPFRVRKTIFLSSRRQTPWGSLFYRYSLSMFCFFTLTWKRHTFAFAHEHRRSDNVKQIYILLHVHTLSRGDVFAVVSGEGGLGLTIFQNELLIFAHSFVLRDHVALQRRIIKKTFGWSSLISADE